MEHVGQRRLNARCPASGAHDEIGSLKENSFNQMADRLRTNCWFSEGRAPPGRLSPRAAVRHGPASVSPLAWLEPAPIRDVASYRDRIKANRPPHLTVSSLIEG